MSKIKTVWVVLVLVALLGCDYEERGERKMLVVHQFSQSDRWIGYDYETILIDPLTRELFVKPGIIGEKGDTVSVRIFGSNRL